MSVKPTYEELEKKVIKLESEAFERKRAEETLREHASMLENLLHSAAEGICLCHNISDYPNVEFTHWNPRMTEITGYTLDEINRLGWYQTMYPDPDIQNQAIERMARMRIGDDIRAEEWVITTKNGEDRVLSISTSVVAEGNGVVHVLGLMQDITERKEAEEALRKSEERFKFLAENMGDIVWTLNMNFEATYVSPSIEKVLGFTPEERKRQKLEEMATPESMARITAMYLEELQRDAVKDVDAGRSVAIEVEYYHRNGSIVWIENIVKAIRDETGAIVGMYGVSRDITQRKDAEKALSDSEEKFKLLAEHSADIIYKINLESEQYTYASPSLEKLFGYSVEEVLSLKAKDTVTAESYAKQQEKLINALADNRKIPEIMEIETVHKDGHIIPVEVHVNFIPDELGNPIEILGVARDISERKRAE